MVVTWDSLTGVASTTVASATTTDIAGAATQNIIISGNTDITDFGTVAAGTLRLVKSSGTAKLKYDATKMILPGGADITMAINDTFVAQSLGSGNWIVIAYKKQTGKSVIPPAASDITGTLAATSGGTGQATYTVGDLLYADTTTTLAKLADAALLNALISGGAGVAPSWGKIGYGAMQNVSVTDKLLGRSTAGTGIVEEIACTAQGRNLLAQVDQADLQDVIGTAAFVNGTKLGQGSVTFDSQNYVTLVTLPAGVRCIPTYLRMWITAASSPVGTSAGVIALGYTASGYSDFLFTFLPGTTFNAVDDFFGYAFPSDGNGRLSCPESTAIKVGCGTPITSGSITVFFQLYGFYY